MPFRPMFMSPLGVPWRKGARLGYLKDEETGTGRGQARAWAHVLGEGRPRVQSGHPEPVVLDKKKDKRGTGREEGKLRVGIGGGPL